jgi:hypothetical protein
VIPRRVQIERPSKRFLRIDIASWGRVSPSDLMAADGSFGILVFFLVNVRKETFCDLLLLIILTVGVWSCL